jgi:xylose dehydrogenase (NAD/NADP)
MDIGLYPLNTTRFLLGADPVEASGKTVSTHDAFADVPDEHAAFTLRFPDDVIATATASQNAYQSSYLKVVGTEGEVTVEPAFFHRQPRGLAIARGDTRIDHEFEQVDQMLEEFDYFANCLLTGRDPYADAEHGLVDMEVMMAIYESGETGEPVALE